MRRTCDFGGQADDLRGSGGDADHWRQTGPPRSKPRTLAAGFQSPRTARAEPTMEGGGGPAGGGLPLTLDGRGEASVGGCGRLP
jgi:hypothetical protein